MKTVQFILVHSLTSFLPDECIYNTDEMNRLKYVHDHGHMLGSHTWAHKNLTTLTWDQSKTSVSSREEI